VSCNYSSKTFNVKIFKFKHRFVGTRHYSKPSLLLPNETEVLMMKVVLHAKKAFMKRRMLNNIEQIDGGEKSE